MDELQYYFDKKLINDKGQSKELLYVKSIFEDLYTNNKDVIFDVLWNNPSLKAELFPEITDIALAKKLFDDLIACKDDNFILYSIINVR